MLKGKKVFLRQLLEEDAVILMSWENNPDNWRVSGTDAPYSLHEINHYITTASAVKASGQLRLMIVEKSSGELIGSIDLFEIDLKNRRAHIGILIAQPEYRGKGFASESIDLMIYYAQEHLNISNFVCSIQDDNENSIQLFESKGFQQVGVRKEWYIRGKEYFDELLYQKIVK